MSPNEMLARIRVLSIRLSDHSTNLSDTGRLRLAGELAEATRRLDDHITMGGKLPADWRRN